MPRSLRRKNLAPPGKCIFCEGASGSGMSKEHIFPDWLRELFPRSPEDTHTHGFTSWAELSPGSPLSPITRSHRGQGQASTKKVRVVCRKCNNEWLGRLEKRMKPLLSQLIMGESVSLGDSEQLFIATWAAKTIMTAEYVDRKKVAVPQSDRTFLMRNLSPPQNGRWIWIAGSQSMEWLTGINHFSARLNISPVDLKTPEIVNLQSTTIGIARLLIHAISTTVPGHSFALNDPDNSDLRQIWPLGPEISWPPQNFLTDDQVNGIARNVPRAFGHSA